MICHVTWRQLGLHWSQRRSWKNQYPQTIQWFLDLFCCIVSCCVFLYSSHKIVDVVEVVPEKGSVGKTFKKDAKVIMDRLSSLTPEEVTQLEDSMKTAGFICTGRDNVTVQCVRNCVVCFAESLFWALVRGHLNWKPKWWRCRDTRRKFTVSIYTSLVTFSRFLVWFHSCSQLLMLCLVWLNHHLGLDG